MRSHPSAKVEEKGERHVLPFLFLLLAHLLICAIIFLKTVANGFQLGSFYPGIQTSTSRWINSFATSGSKVSILERSYLKQQNSELIQFSRWHLDTSWLKGRKKYTPIVLVGRNMYTLYSGKYFLSWVGMKYFSFKLV